MALSRLYAKLAKATLSVWASGLVYIALSVVMTWPLAQHLNTRLSGSNQDLFNVYWGNWWVPKALAMGQSPYMTRHLIYPVGFDLTTFAFSPFLALVSLPLNWILPPIAAYNLTVWVTIVLCCIAVDQLLRYLTHNPWAALVAGITLGFAPCLAAERQARLNLAMVAWIPWTALLLTRLMREAKIRDAVLLSVTIGLSFLTRPQMGVLVLVFCGIYFCGLVWVERKQWPRLAWGRLLLSGLLACLLLLPLFVHIVQRLNQPEAENLVREALDDPKTDLVPYVLPPPEHPLFGNWTGPIYRHQFPRNVTYRTFVGFVPILLCLYALVSRPRQALPWALTGLSIFVLALGPNLRVNGQSYQDIKLPYSITRDLFSAIGLDDPYRFNLAVMPALATLVGLACAGIATRIGRLWPLSILAALIMFEYLVVPMELMVPPPHSPFYDRLAADGEDYAIVDLPLDRVAGEIHRYYQTIHHKPIVGGWDRRVPTSSFAFIERNPLLRAWKHDQPLDGELGASLAELSRADVRYIILHKDQLRGSLPALPDLLFALTPSYEDGDICVFATDAVSGQAYDVVHRFDRDVNLVEPNERGVSFPLEGYAFPVARGAPVGILAYWVAAGDGALWVDLSWQSSHNRSQPYVLTAWLADLATGRPVALSPEVAGDLEWTAQDTPRMPTKMPIPKELPQGEYRLGVEIHFPGDSDDAATPEQLGDTAGLRDVRWSGHKLVLDAPILALPTAFKASATSTEGRVVVYTAAPAEAPIEPQHKVDLRFGEVARLIGYSVGQQPVRAGQELDLTLYWESVHPEPPAMDYSAFVHLLDAGGEIVAQHDGEPVAGRRPTHTWRRGDQIIDTHRLVWQAQEYAGPATVAAGLYDGTTGERLPAHTAQGQRWPADRAVLGEVTVE